MLENLTTMSDEDRDRPLIRNEATLHRRAWIDQALASVRARLRPAELGEPGALPVDSTLPDADEPTGARPRLYVVKR